MRHSRRTATITPAGTGQQSSRRQGTLSMAGRRMERWLKRYCELVVAHPVRGVVIGVGLNLLLTIIALSAYPIVTDTSGAAFYPQGTRFSLREQAAVVAHRATRFNPTGNDDQVTQQQTDESYELVLYFWDQDGNNVLTNSRVDFIRDFENKVTSQPGYTDFCLRPFGGSTDCLPPTSLTKFLYSQPIAGCPGKFEPNGKAATRPRTIDNTLLAMIDPTATPSFCETNLTAGCTGTCTTPVSTAADFAVDKKFGYKDGNTAVPPNLNAFAIKSTIKFGLPLAGYTNKVDRHDEQISKIEDFVKSYDDLVRDAEFEGMVVRYLSPILIEVYFQDIIFRDSILAVVSLFLVFLYVWFHTQSFLISSLGMLHVVLSLPVAYLLLQILLRVQEVGVLTFMAIYIILGIGADDIFIFVDAWKQSANSIKEKDASGVLHELDASKNDVQTLQKRLYFAYHRSATTMLITSLTTSTAFMLNLASKVPAIQVFGFFTACMCLINYVMVITYFPCVVVTWQYYFHNRRCCCSKEKETYDAAREGSGIALEGISAGLSSRTESGSSIEESNANEPMKEIDVEAGEPQKDRRSTVFDPNAAVARPNIAKYRPLERFFHNKWAPFIYERRYFVIATFLVWIAIAIYFASTLAAAKEPTRWVPNSDPIQQAFLLEGRDMKRPSTAQEVWITHGVGGIDKSGVNIFRPTDLGSPEFDDALDLSSTVAQQAYIDMCAEARLQSFVLNNEVLCPMEEFKNHVENVLGGTFPVAPAAFLTTLANFTSTYEATFGPVGDGLPYELEDREQTSGIGETIRFHPITTEEPNLRLAYMVMIVNTTITQSADRAEKEAGIETFDAFVDRKNSDPTYQAATMGNGQQTSSTWVSVELEDTLFDSATIGIAVSLSGAFLIMFLFLRNLVISVLATISIGGIVCSLICIMVWIGWSLGLIESICITILVGLSVDYVIHMAHAYNVSRFQTRKVRLQEALTDMGVSVLSASITTFLGAFILFFTYILFFVRFGYFIGLTIVLSAVFAFGFFCALLSIFGPTKKVDDIQRAWGWLKEKLGKDD